MTVAERDKLSGSRLLGEARLSCQIRCDIDALPAQIDEAGAHRTPQS